MTTRTESYDILNDDMTEFESQSPAFVTFGEVMIRDTPADLERPERTRLVHISLAGSEFTLAIGVRRMGISSAFITRLPDNPYGISVRNTAREQGVNTEFMVWAPKTEPIGRFIYEIGKTPRRNVGVYQRMFSAASKLDAGMVDWKSALEKAKLLHVSGITFGLSKHSGYDHNYCEASFKEAIEHLPEGCKVGLDFNYRSTLWSPEDAKSVMTPIIRDHIDILITTIEDMAKIYGIGCGRYTAKQVVDGDMDEINDDDIRAFALEVIEKLGVEIVAITIRYPDSFEQHRWESAAMHMDGSFVRSKEVKKITLLDRLGGGDTWNAGFYYGLLTSGFNGEGIHKGLLVGDCATRIKQTIMFDLPIVEKREIQALLIQDIEGGGKRTSR
ncbi:MAG: sugar kinase [Anaerolineales bacterium]